MYEKPVCPPMMYTSAYLDSKVVYESREGNDKVILGA